jgi:O-antigen/teichoic acid export membrane protein
MNKLRRLIGNTVISLFGQVVTWTSTLLLTIAYGQFLGDVKFGELYFAITFVSLIGTPIEVGFNQQVTRDVAEDPEKAPAYLWNTLLIKLSFWVFLYAIIIFLSWILGYSPEQRSIVAICGIDLLTGSIVNVFAALHYAFERTISPAVGMILEKGLTAITGFILLKYGASVQVMACVLLGGSVIDLVWQAAGFFRLSGRHVALDKKILRHLIGNSIPFIVSGTLGVIYYRIDTVLLSLMTTTAVVGWYGAGYRLFDTLFFLPNIIINAVMFPVFSKLLADSRSQSTLKMAIEKSMNLLVICAVPIATLFIIAAPNIITFLYHRPDFANTIPVIQALAPGIIFIYINALLLNIIITTRGEKRIPLMSVIALIFNLGLNLYLIPRYQQTGAAAVTSLTELLLLCISLFLVPKHLLPKESLKVIIKVLVAALAMSLGVLLMRSQSILFILPVALLIYASAALLLRTVPREDVQALFSALRSKGKAASPSQVFSDGRDESIYWQITEQLPAVKRIAEDSRSVKVEACGSGDLSENDEIREREAAANSLKRPRFKVNLVSLDSKRLQTPGETGNR